VKQLAKLSRVDLAVIERIEVADQPPTLEIIRKLAAALERPVQALMVDDGRESRSEEAPDSEDPAHENVGR
jgi:transcriptional regulator with XRE-family HTH domain